MTIKMLSGFYFKVNSHPDGDKSEKVLKRSKQEILKASKLLEGITVDVLSLRKKRRLPTIILSLLDEYIQHDD